MEIDTTRSKYIPVATRTQLLFFCTTDLSNIDPMYQYSLEWYVRIFLNSIASAEKSGQLIACISDILKHVGSRVWHTNSFTTLLLEAFARI